MLKRNKRNPARGTVKFNHRSPNRLEGNRMILREITLRMGEMDPERKLDGLIGSAFEDKIPLRDINSALIAGVENWSKERKG